MSSIRSVCVFCGSRSAVAAPFRAAATRLGTILGERGIDIVYGGGRIGLMGMLADAALAAGGRVIGIIPQFLHEIEVAHEGVHELVVTETMHERKEQMYRRSDAFIVLPGGIGTFDETIEVATHIQLRRFNRPLILVDVDGYWQPLLDLMRHGVSAGFIGPETLDIFTVVHQPEEVLDGISRAQFTP